MNRRGFLRGAAAAALFLGRSRAETLLADRHTGLQSATLEEVTRPASVEEVQAAVRNASSVCVGGRLHSEGGQQLLQHGHLLDMTGMRRLLSIDTQRGLVDIEPGLRWDELVGALREQAPTWSIRQKQTISSVTLGGSVSANAHGHPTRGGPLVGDVEELDIVDADGQLRTIARDRNPQWFSMVVGGYGLVGVVTRVRLRLQPRVRLRLLCELLSSETVSDRMAYHRDRGASYASCEMDTSSGLTRGILLYHTPDEAEAAPRFSVRPADWVAAVALLHRDRSRSYAETCAAWLKLAGRSYWVDDVLTSESYVDNYHRLIGPGCDPIVEYLVPPHQLAPTLRSLHQRITAAHIPILLCSIRHLDADTDTILSYVPTESVCIALMLHVDGPGDTLQQTLWRCTEDVIGRGGRLHPAFGRYASPTQLRACLSFDSLVSLKRQLDPGGRFRSDWYDYYTSAS